MATSSSSAGAPADVLKTPSPPTSPKEDLSSSEQQPLLNEVHRETNFQEVTGIRSSVVGATGKQNPPSLASRVRQAVLLTPLYPVRFIRVLIQLGHEPVPPERRYIYSTIRCYVYYWPGLLGWVRAILKKDGLSELYRKVTGNLTMFYWPSIIGYARAIVRKDGWRELYCGVTGSLAVELINITASSLLSPIIKREVAKILLTIYPNNGGTPGNEGNNTQTTRAILVRGIGLFFHHLILKLAVTVIVQPFYVVAVRMIAQHVGKETLYSTLLGSLREIYHREGVTGFYKGVVPALLGGVLSTVVHTTIWMGLELVANMVTHELGKSVIRQILRPPLLSYIPWLCSYPFEVMRAVMAANGSGLLLGMEPHTPQFGNWRDAYRHLKTSHAMYRGSILYLPRHAYTNVTISDAETL